MLNTHTKRIQARRVRV